MDILGRRRKKSGKKMKQRGAQKFKILKKKKNNKLHDGFFFFELSGMHRRKTWYWTALRHEIHEQVSMHRKRRPQQRFKGSRNPHDAGTSISGEPLVLLPRYDSFPSPNLLNPPLTLLKTRQKLF